MFYETGTGLGTHALLSDIPGDTCLHNRIRHWSLLILTGAFTIGLATATCLIAGAKLRTINELAFRFRVETSFSGRFIDITQLPTPNAQRPTSFIKLITFKIY